MKRRVHWCIVVGALLTPLIAGAQLAPPRFVRGAGETAGEAVEVDPSAVKMLRQRVSVTFDGVPRRDALQLLADRASLRLVYANDVIAADELVRYRGDDVPVFAVLTELLRGTNVDVAASARGTVVIKRRAPSVRDRPSGSIDGRVVDEELRGIENADVQIMNTPVILQTSPAGRFLITDVRPRPYVVTVRKMGYQPLALIVSVAEGDTARLSFTLQRMALGLDTVRVVVDRRSRRMSEFARRKKAGLGAFVTADELARFQTSDLGNVLRRTPGVIVTYDERNRSTSIQTTRTRGYALGCPMKIIVDEVPMPSGVDIALLPNVSEIAAIEIYTTGNTVPTSLGVGAVCGAVLLWTKTAF